jgi:hypothetical protein
MGNSGQSILAQTIELEKIVRHERMTFGKNLWVEREGLIFYWPEQLLLFGKD